MATKFKFEIESDGLNTAQTLAFKTFIGTLGGTEFLEDLRQEEVKDRYDQESFLTQVTEEKPKATRKKAEKVDPSFYNLKDAQAPKTNLVETYQETEAEQPQQVTEEVKAIEVVEPETVRAPTLMQIRSLVAEKAKDHKDSIKAKLVELGAQNVSTLDAKHFQTIFDFLTDL